MPDTSVSVFNSWSIIKFSRKKSDYRERLHFQSGSDCPAVKNLGLSGQCNRSLPVADWIISLTLQLPGIQKMVAP
jgi:hypothetical protein